MFFLSNTNRHVFNVFFACIALLIGETVCHAGDVLYKDKHAQFEYRIPGSPWHVITPTKANRQALFAIQKELSGGKKQTFMILAAENNDSEFSLEIFKYFVKKEVKGIYPDDIITEEKPHTINGLKGFNLSIYRDDQIFFKIFGYKHGSILYQFLFSGHYKNQDTVKIEFIKLISNFKRSLPPPEEGNVI